MGHKQPGLDGRHRDNDGEIHRKRGDTLIGTVRKEHPGFAPGTRSDSRLDTYLEKEGFDSLNDALKNKRSE